MARGTRKRLEAVCQLAITHHKGLTVADTCFGRATDIHSASEDALRGATLRATDGTGTMFTNPCDTRRLMSEPKFKKCFTRPWLGSMWNKQRRALNVTRFSQPRTFLGRFLLLKKEIGCDRERSITSGWQWYRAEARSHSLMIWPRRCFDAMMLYPITSRARTSGEEILKAAAPLAFVNASCTWDGVCVIQSP